jgi:putative tributyrin esterase
MALFNVHFSSEVLRVRTSMEVIIPQDVEAAPDHMWPTLYLLHGLSDDHTAWTRWTSIERYADARKIAVVMATTARGFYVDAVQGYRYGEFFSTELPALCGTFFRLSPRREDTFVAGLSMGGFGAISLALNHPDKYAAAASLSGVLDTAEHFTNNPDFDPNTERGRELERIFGPFSELEGGPNDLFALLASLKASRRSLPALYQCCGTEDFLYEGNVRFRDHARSLGVPLTYEESPGTHEWGFWDAAIQRVLAWLPLKTA